MFQGVSQPTKIYVRTYIPHLYFELVSDSHWVFTYKNSYSIDKSIYGIFSHWQNDSKNEFYNYVSIPELFKRCCFT